MCVRPIQLTSKAAGDLVPCGFCVECRSRYRRDWAVRCLHEASLHEENAYVTLTYRPADLPAGGTLVLEHVQAFWKALRYEIAPHGPWCRCHPCMRMNVRQVKYFLAGEYGEEKLRPHYHFLVFGWQPKELWPREQFPFPLFESPQLERVWGKGDVRVGMVNEATCAYVAGYVMKKVDEVKRRRFRRFCDPETGEYREVLAEFSTQSRGARKGARGLGYGWFQKYGEEVERLGSIRLGGKEVSSPRYYDELLREEDEARWEMYKLRRARKYRSKDPDARPLEVRREEEREAMAREVMAIQRWREARRRL